MPYKHGHAAAARRTPEYRAWYHMIQRCSNPNDEGYEYYGARGVSVCSKWRTSFEAFLTDMGLRPTNNHSIDRIDTNGNYEATNCRWAPPFIQANNRRNNRTFTHEGQTHSIAEWTRIVGLPYDVLYGRLRFGWSFADAIRIPQGHRRK